MADYVYYNGELYHASKKKKVKYIAKVPNPDAYVKAAQNIKYF